MPRDCRPLFLLLIAWLGATPAMAQVSGSVTAYSDDRYRGASLSDGLPTGSVAIAWDRADGWYAGAQLTRVRFAVRDARWEMQVAPYVGYVHVLRDGITAEAGVRATWYSRSHHYRSAELYAGLNGQHVQGRLSWTPDYFGDVPAWYGELDGDRPLRGSLRAIAHVGVLRTADDADYPGYAAKRWRVDVAAGLGYTVAGLEVQAQWVASPGGHAERYRCAPWQCGPRSGWMVSVTRNW